MAKGPAQMWTESEIAWISRKQVIGILGTVVTFLGLGSLAGWSSLISYVKTVAAKAATETVPQIEQINVKLTQAEADRNKAVSTLAQAQGLLQTLPVGTILQVGVPQGGRLPAGWDDALPRNWVVCDGATVNGEHRRKFKQEEVHERYWNVNVPDLRGRLLGGSQGLDKAGQLAGSPTIPGHAHQLPALTGAIASAMGQVDPGTGKYGVRDGHGGWNENNHISVESSTASEGQHRHTLSGSLTQEPQSFVPEYYGVVFIMRIF